MRFNVGLAAGFELAHDAVDDPLDAVFVDRALVQRDAYRAGELFPVEGDAAVTRSMVVKRWPQAAQKRRRRIAPPSSLGRLSLTAVSDSPQNGQRMIAPSQLWQKA
jgi:hypothetical protein